MMAINKSPGIRGREKRFAPLSTHESNKQITMKTLNVLLSEDIEGRNNRYRGRIERKE